MTGICQLFTVSNKLGGAIPTEIGMLQSLCHIDIGKERVQSKATYCSLLHGLTPRLVIVFCPQGQTEYKALSQQILET